MSNTGYNGQNDVGAGSDDWAAIALIARRAMLEIVTTKPVIVRAVRNNGALAAAGFIDVQPLVNQVDGSGNPTPHGIIYNIPYIRMQGGANAIIMDPEVNDLGVCGFCTHDISAVKSSRDISNPASNRRFDHADGVYIGGMLNGIPTQYIQFSGGGIEMHSPTKIKLTSPLIEITATTSITETAPQIIENASASISQSTATFTLAATTTAGITSPTSTVTGAAIVTGLTSLNGGFAALPRSGGGASTIASDVSITGATTLNGNVASTGALTNNGKSVGSALRVGGVQTGSGTSGTPV